MATRNAHASPPDARSGLCDVIDGDPAPGRGPGDLLLTALLACARGLSPICASVDALSRPRRTARVRAALVGLDHPPGRVLRAIWFTRTARELLRVFTLVGGDAALRRRIRVTGDTSALVVPSVLATVHSDWWRFVARQTAAGLGLALLARPAWRSRLGATARIHSVRDLRALLAHLDGGGSCALTVDHFDLHGSATSPATMLGRAVRVPTSSARLAARARIPLVPLSVRWSSGRIVVQVHEAIDAASEGPEPATRMLFDVLAGAILEDPAAWTLTHRFLGAAPHA